MAAIAPPSVAPEHPFLSAIRSNALLNQIQHADSSSQGRRTARLVGDLAAITSMLTMSFADLLFRCMSDTQIIHNATLQAIDIIHELCAQLLVLLDWSFSEEHCSLTTRLLSAFTCFAGMQTCPLTLASTTRPPPSRLFWTKRPS